MTQPAPYFSLARAAWMPCVVEWDKATGEFRRIEGGDQPDYEAALDASPFLVASPYRSI